MAFLLKGPDRRKRWVFRPLFLLIIWGLLALLLLINGIYETKRLKDNLYRLLYDEGSALIAGPRSSSACRRDRPAGARRACGASG